MTLRALLAVATVSLCLSACGGNNTRSITSPPPVTYTIGGTVSGLSGTGLVLQDNGGDNLPVNAAGTFTFPTSIVSGGAYSVSVLTQPSSPAQTCLVTNSSGKASANVTNVNVACAYTIGGTVSGLSGAGFVLQNNAGNNLTVQMNGGFTFGVPLASGGNYDVTVFTQPTHPAQTCLVTSGSGIVDANITSVQVACTTTQTPQWTWVNGSTIINQPGTYGTQGTAAPTNVPGARDGAVSWTDTAGNLWLFGGASALGGAFNDLWQYSSGEWTWIAGANVTGQAGTYGTQGVAAPGNVPGARAGAVSWTDVGGNLWLFGGYDGNINNNWFNDLWKFSAGEWTWVSGANTSNQNGIYGTMGTAAPLNAPGARWEAVSWIDAAGNLWLFGGNGFDSTGTFASLNDLWKYQAGQWTWMSGSNLASQSGTYGTQGVAAPGNVPGARSLAVSWIDPAGNLWLFAGNGDNSAGTNPVLNDLWKYSAGEWTWVSGSNVVNQSGTYGTQGIAAAGNVPGARSAPIGWADAAGNLWLFGGGGYDSIGQGGKLNDLWEYSSGEWAWMGGSNLVNQGGSYGTQGIAAPSNIPGSRSGGVGWVDAAGNFWLFGGAGLDSSVTAGGLNDLWEYQP